MLTLIWHIAVSIPVIFMGGLLLLRWLRNSGVRIDGMGSALWKNKVAFHPQPAGKKALWVVWGSALGFRILILGLAEGYMQYTGRATGTPLSYWVRWDAQHYLGLAASGYSGYIEDGRPLFLVFFPLYVWLLRVVRLLLQEQTIAGIAVSCFCFAFGCCRLYALAAETYGKNVAWRCVLFLSVFPFSFFFGGIMTESLFLLTTVSALYHIRRHRWLAAGAWGFLAALTRMQGVLVILAGVIELVETDKPFAWTKEERQQRIRRFVKRLLFLFAPLAGTGVYLLLNWYVAGDALAFVQMQSHWNQGGYPVSGTLLYVWQEAVKNIREAIGWEIWWPQLLLFLSFFVVIAVSFRQVRSMECCYAFSYLIASYSLSWLLSGGRYLSCNVPVFLFLGILTKGRPVLTALLATGMAGLFCLYLTAYLSGGYVM